MNIKYVLGSAVASAMITGSGFLRLFDRGAIPQNSKIETLRLRVEPGSIQEMASNLPVSAKKKYYRAWLQYPDGEYKSIKYRFRGRNIWHWHPKKPSLRLKLKKKYPLNLQKAINLINPEDRAMVSNVMGEELAKRLGVLTHVTDYVRLFINDEYRGVYHRTTREDEQMLLLNKRVPGPLFIGDNLGKKWKAEQFEKTGATDKIGKYNPINKLLEIMELPQSPHKYKKLWNLISFEKLAAWQATMNISSSMHTNYVHNHLYYFDPALGFLEPVISDINGHGLLTHARGLSRFWLYGLPQHVLPINEMQQPLLDIALKDPRFYHERNKILYKALKTVGSLQEQKKTLNNYFSLIDPDVKADFNKGSLEPMFVGWFRTPYSNWQYEIAKQSVFKWIEKRNSFLIDQLNQVEVSVQIEHRKAGNTNLIVSVSGNASVYFNSMQIDGQLFAILPFENGKYEKIDGPLLLFPGLKEDYNFYYKHTQGFRSPEYYLFSDIQHYAFVIKSETPADIVEQINGSFTHSLTNKKIKPRITIKDQLDHKKIKYNKVSLHPWQFGIKQNTQDIILGPGVVTLKEDLIIPHNRALIIKQGTTLLLGKGVSIATKGPVFLQGSKENPVHIKRLSSSDPWGAFIIHGINSKGSRISHSHFSGGSLDRIFNVDYSGMVSIHGSDDITIEDSSFSKNILSDDLLHIVYGNVKLINVKFLKCFSDCIDFDLVTGEVENVHIVEAGNDGIDFMTSYMSLTNISVEKALDKALSVGEASKINVDSGSINNSNVGVAIKDQSKIKLSRLKLQKNHIAVDVFKKNWRYGGSGEGHLSEIEFINNEVNLQVEKGGSLFLKQEIPGKIHNDGIIKQTK